MEDALRSFVGDQARHLARCGSFSSRIRLPRPWWPEETCMSIEWIDWIVSGLDELDECWQKFTAYDRTGSMLGKY